MSDANYVKEISNISNYTGGQNGWSDQIIRDNRDGHRDKTY